MLAKYPDLDSDRSKTYLRNAFRVGLKNESLVLARKEGDCNWKSILTFNSCSHNFLPQVRALARTRLPRLPLTGKRPRRKSPRLLPMEKSLRRKLPRKRQPRMLMQVSENESNDVG